MNKLSTSRQSVTGSGRNRSSEAYCCRIQCLSPRQLRHPARLPSDLTPDCKDGLCLPSILCKWNHALGTPVCLLLSFNIMLMRFKVAAAFSSYGGDLSLPLGLALGSPIFPSGCEGKLGVALESPQGNLEEIT